MLWVARASLLFILLGWLLALVKGIRAFVKQRWS